MTRKRPTSAPALLVALSMAVCLGAAVDVNASSQRHRAERTVSFTAAEREALASLLACLSDTRKQRLAEEQAHRLNIVPTPRRIVDAPLAQPPRRLDGFADPLGPGSPAALARSHLVNLPPPR